MSTRSAIARIKGDRWEGVYHHSDGYPTGLGCYLFRLLHHQFFGDLEAMLKYAIDDHPGGWSHISPGRLLIAGEGGDGYSDEEAPQCYCHGYFRERDGERDGRLSGCDCLQNPYRTSQVDGPECDPLFIEWIYAFDPDSMIMTILEHHGEDLPGTVGSIIRKLDGTVDQMPERVYKHRIVATISLLDPEPDWARIECGDDEEYYQMRQGGSWVDSHFPPGMES